jgi:AcrR family transcriptional regulator
MEKLKKIKTKDKILFEAIKLYNEQGIQNVTSRHIASKMGISHGNLDYHYNTKEDIILAIYDKMRSEMTESYGSRKEGASAIEQFHILIQQLEEFQYKYRFFNLDVLEVTRSFPSISELIQETFIKRKKTTIQLFQEFISSGFMVEMEESELERLEHIIRMIITFWLSQREVMSSYKFSEMGSMVKSIWTIINPHLTDLGIEEYEKAIMTHGYTFTSK